MSQRGHAGGSQWWAVDLGLMSIGGRPIASTVPGHGHDARQGRRPRRRDGGWFALVPQVNLSL